MLKPISGKNDTSDPSRNKLTHFLLPMGADDAHGAPALHITAIRTWHRAAMVLLVVHQTNQIQLSANTNTQLWMRDLWHSSFSTISMVVAVWLESMKSTKHLRPAQVLPFKLQENTQTGHMDDLSNSNTAS